MSGASDYIDQEMAGIPGWFSAIDAWVFTAISEWQHEDGLVGDVLEIGVYKGRSAVLLGHLLGESERLVFCDLFDDPTAGYEGVTLDGFLATYGHHHRRPPVVYQCPSRQLGELETTRVFRMIHVDGSHAYDDVRSDIALVPNLLQGGGIVVLDDYRTLHTPGVAAAVWEAVATRDLSPICVTHDKMYASWGPERPGTIERVRRMVATIPWVEAREDTVCGHDVVVVLPKGHFEDPPGPRRRLVRSLLPPVVVDFGRRLRDGLR
ncbi:MAG: class I SAM-dependent methyltransferase [Actinobacteria bacterium]|nr:class I SAM-dependent methyltransferase [Actinomycetota bacterium]